MASLNQIRESLASVQSYKLPDRYEPVKNTEHQNERTQPLLDPETIKRYRAAQSKYLRSQITNLVIEHLKTLKYDPNDEDGNRPMIEFPEAITEEERNSLRRNMEAAKDNLCRSVSQVKQSYEGVYHKYQILEQRRKELKNIVNELENKEKNGNPGGGGLVDIDIDGHDGHMDDEDDALDQSELELHEERLQSLVAKRSMMEAQLRKIRMETEQTSSQIASKKELLQKLMNVHDPPRDDSERSRSASSNAVEDIMNGLDVEQMKAQTDEMRLQTQHFRDMSDFYESMKTAMEVISGIKILSVTDAKSDTVQGGSPRQNRRHSRDLMDGAIALKIQLLDHHIVEIVLYDTKNPSATGDCFRVLSARLLTSEVLTDTLLSQEEYENNPTPTVSITIPPLDDLVSLAANLEPVQDLRFVLRESLARIRTLSARMNELAALRKKYLTKITNPSKNRVNYGFGGEDQEILCSLDSQVTVVVRLTADCPILKGSAYIQRIVGCGGWEDAVLQRIKAKVNEQRSSGPIDLMDLVVDEINRVVKEDGVKIPKTPSLPRRKANNM